MRVAVTKSSAVPEAWNRCKERELSHSEEKKKRDNLAEESEKANIILLKFNIQKGQIVSHPLSILPIQHIIKKYQSSQ